MQKVGLSAPLLGLLLLVALCSAASIGVAKDEKLTGAGRGCVQDDKGNLVCGKIVVGPGSPAPPSPMPTGLDLLLPPMPPRFHEVRDNSGEFKMLLPWDLFSLPSILDDFSDDFSSFPLDEIFREMGKAQHSCAPVPGQVMSDGTLTMDCYMAGDDLPGPVSMHVTYDLSDLPDDFDVKDLMSGRGIGMLLPPPLWQMLTDSIPSQLPAVPLIAPPKMPYSPPTPTQQPEKADKDKSNKLDPFHPQMNDIRSSFDAMFRDAMSRPMATPTPIDRPMATVSPGMHLSIDGDVSVLGNSPSNVQKTKY